ncbi:uncharacterized protein LOC120329054 [Styela clava]|uniref:uncharacterized protein LOC120329054 n=1 Tax=Styela clava TaxID=7725 RepID=UPI0019395F29|nr:uncharacterized protein LOC120329054 [Styela clava]
MILLMCLWHRSSTQTLFCLFAWPILHYFFMFCLSHISVTAHVSGCCQKPGSRVVKPCKKRMRDVVRTLLTFTHSMVVPLWSAMLLGSHQFDVESNSVLQLQSLSFHIYALYWNLADFTGSGRSSDMNEKPRYTKKTVALHILHNVFCAVGIFLNLRTVSREMHGWRNSVMDLMDLSMTWKSPSSTQRRVLSHHLLAKTSVLSWVMTAQLLVHESPNIFYYLLALLRMSPSRNVGFQANTWTPTLGDHKTNYERAASLGAAAWLRERGGSTGPVVSGTTQASGREGRIRTAHFLSFAGIRIVGGFIALRKILIIGEVVKDTLYLSTILLHYALALYMFGGVVTFATKRMTRSSSGDMPVKSISWRMMTSVNDEWLR